MAAKPTAPSAPTIGDWLEVANPQEELKTALRKALRDLDQAKRKNADLARAVYEAARDGVAALTIPPVPKPAPDRRKKDAETAIVMLSDWQLGKTTPTYNSQVTAERIERLAEKVERLVAIQRADHPVRELHCAIIGDVVEGEMIFPQQSHHIDASLYRQVVVDGPAILAGFLRRMAATFDKVHVTSVIGNHGAIGGRARKEMHPESNADAMLYEVTRLITEDEPRITWGPTSTAGERHWFQTFTVGTKRFFIFHGDQIRGGGFAGFPFYGAAKRLYGWHLSLTEFDYALFGHYHTPTRLYLNGITAWCNGSTESTNTYALEELASAGEPCQWLLFASDRGVTAEYLVRLEE